MKRPAAKPWEAPIPSSIVGIHGLANKPPREEKAGWWADALAEGLRRNLGRDETVALDFVYWADLRYPEPLRDRDNREPYRPDHGLGPFPSPMGEPRRRTPTVTDRIYRGLATLQEAVGFTPVDDAILEFRLDDLWGYHDDRAFRDAARGRLREALARHRDGPVLLLAHSMGGLIAYDVLRLAERDGSVAGPVTLVTLGAPLGLAEVKKTLAEEHGDLCLPRSVAAWHNLMDRNDIATVGEDLAATFPPNAAGVRVRDVPVINAYRAPDGHENTHKSYGYLRTPELSRIVAGFWDGRNTPCIDPDGGVSGVWKE
ncbi:lysophospholipase [Methylobacterium aerolatum]|uniref:lysophospholipase n=1 Tax=Methylobacterium aerolatum TaxID=418708 RepID=UPI001EE04BCD|nr:lysophospholipase [Methylobacterium aerolatum]